MMRRFVKLMALVLAVAMLLSGCVFSQIGDVLDRFYESLMLGTAVSFEDMEYVRPDMTAFRTALDTAMEQAKTEENVRILMQSVNEVYLLFYQFSTAYNLANIHYCRDMTDIYWEAEYSWCMENSSEISAGLDRLLYALADSPLREKLENDHFFGQGFFDMYEGESLWDESFTALMEEEAALIDRYYELNAQALETAYYSDAYFDGVGAQIEQVFLEMIDVRQRIAEKAGYESYPEFAYSFYFYRDYTPQQARGLLDSIATELVPLYEQLDASIWEPLNRDCTEAQTLAYVQECAEAMGGVAADALALMTKTGTYDITYSETKYDASFEVFLLDYATPHVFMNPRGNQQDKLTFAHEFGHYCNDYAVGGTVTGVDVAEVFSQGLEYLSLCYCSDTLALTRAKMAESLCVFVEQAAYAGFELQVYDLKAEELTTENVRKIYAEVAQTYGFDQPDRDSREYTLVPHFFISPMYVISYVVSNDAAMQIYQAELTEKGSGAALWESSLYTVQTGYLAFLEETGLESSFAQGRVEQLRKLFEERLGN